MFADVDFAHPEVQKDVIAWGEWIVNQCKLSGFRFDAVQHFSENFTNDFVRNLEEKFGKDKLFCVGEFWVGNVDSLCGYLKDMHHKFSLFDAPLLYNFSRISTTENRDLRSVFDKTLVKAEPYNAVTLVMNHDTQPGQTVETPIEGFFKPLAYSLILLRQEGYPQLFYGDLYGMKGKNPEPVACGGKLPDLTLVRKLYAYGDQEDYFDEPNCIGFVRRGTWDHPAGLACVMSNAGPGQKRVRRIALDL
jgi:alpha-amylase